MLDVNSSRAYFRDSLVPFSEANVSIASSPMLYGLSIYTTVSVYADSAAKQLVVFRLRDHYERLVNSAKIMDFHEFIDMWSYKKFETMVVSLLRENKVTENVLVRVSVFIDELLTGTRVHGLRNSVSAFVYPTGEFLPLSGVHVCVSSWVRTPDNAIPSRAKANGSYLNASLMKNEALLNGYDEAISLDQHGHVAESTVANVFLVRDGVLVTPSAATDILEGITRASILTLADELGLQAEERTVDRSELYIADEIFLCGSSAYITPVLSVDKRAINGGKIGSLTKQMTTLYRSAREDAKGSHSEWRTVVKV